MSFLAATDTASRQIEQEALLTPSDPKAFEPGLFEGSGTAAALGAGRVGAVFNQLAGEAEYQTAALVTRPLDDLFDTKLTGFLDQELRQKPAALTASMTPDPYTTGSVGRVLYGLVGIGVPAAVGTAFGGPVGGAVLAGATQTVGTQTDLKAQGVDDATAAGAATIEGLMTTAGVAMPAAIGGKVALNALLYGPAANVAQDVAASKAIGWFLDQQGYEELGDRYSEIQAENIVASALLGSFFGFLGARGETARTADIDAAQVALDRKHIEIDTAPGMPADVAALQTHTARIDKATAQLLAGEPVQVDDIGRGGEFLARPELGPGDEAIITALKESGLPGVMDEVSALEAEVTKRGRSDILISNESSAQNATAPTARDASQDGRAAADAGGGSNAAGGDAGLPLAYTRVADRGDERLLIQTLGFTPEAIYRPSDHGAADASRDAPKSAGDWVELPAESEANNVFARKLQERYDADAAGKQVARLSEADLAGHRTFLSADGDVGFAVAPSGEIVGLFKSAASTKKRATARALPLAVEQGGTHLNPFDGFLPKLYAPEGFVEVARLKFNREYAPDGWDYASLGEPDIVFMRYEQAAVGKEHVKGSHYVDSYDEGLDIARQEVPALYSSGKVMTPEGPVSVDTARAEADAGIQTATADAPGFMAAVNCFLRVGQ